MAEVRDLLAKIVTMTANFASLQQQVQRIENRVNDHAERIARLEQREEILMERMRGSVELGLSRMEMKLSERVTRLEEQARILPRESGPS